MARRTSTGYVDPCRVAALTAIRLIALNDCPGVRPIGIREVSRIFLGKAMLEVVRDYA